MPNYFSLSKPQARILGKFVNEHLPKSLDKLVEKYGAEDALRLHQLKDRLSKADDEAAAE